MSKHKIRSRGAARSSLMAIIAAAMLAVPVLSADRVARETYGDAVSVKLLARLCGSDDPRVRERAVRALGQSHNDLAIEHILRAGDDDDANVRAAAVTAAGEFTARRPASIALVLKCLSDRNRLVVFSAMKTAARMRIKTARAGDALRKLCRRDDPFVQAAALDTLSSLGMAAGDELLKSLMKSPSAAVRLCAAGNAALCDDGSVLVNSLKSLAEPGDDAAVRGVAVATIGKLDFAASADVIARAGADVNPLVRRGAVRAYRNAGRRAAPLFLSDRSPLVVLAAVKAAGDLKDTSSVMRLLEILIDAPDTDLHAAAGDALEKMGADAIIKPVGAMLEKQAGLLSARAGRGRDRGKKNLSRNIRSLCRLLGAFDSREKFSLRLELFNSLKIDDEIQLDLAASLAATASDKVAAAMIARMDFYNRQAAKSLWATLQMIPPYVEYRQDVHAAVIEALARLGAGGAVDAIIATTGVRYQTSRLSAATAAAARALAVLATPAKQAKIESAALTVLNDSHYSHTARLAMSKTAGRLRLSATLPALRKILNEVRYSRQTMRAAAWAIREITGESPPIGEPRLNQPLEWIIRQ